MDEHKRCRLFSSSLDFQSVPREGGHTTRCLVPSRRCWTYRFENEESHNYLGPRSLLCVASRFLPPPRPTHTLTRLGDVTQGGVVISPGGVVISPGGAVISPRGATRLGGGEALPAHALLASLGLPDGGVRAEGSLEEVAEVLLRALVALLPHRLEEGARVGRRRSLARRGLRSVTRSASRGWRDTKPSPHRWAHNKTKPRRCHSPRRQVISHPTP